MVSHLRVDCQELPGNEHIKAEITATKNKRAKKVGFKGQGKTEE